MTTAEELKTDKKLQKKLRQMRKLDEKLSKIENVSERLEAFRLYLKQQQEKEERKEQLKRAKYVTDFVKECYMKEKDFLVISEDSLYDGIASFDRNIYKRLAVKLLFMIGTTVEEIDGIVKALDTMRQASDIAERLENK